jgi:transposase
VSAILLSDRMRSELNAHMAGGARLRERYRAQALLWLAEGISVSEIAARLRVSRQTVYNWSERFRHRARLDLKSRLGDAPRSGRPRTVRGVIDPLIAAVMDKNPQDLGCDVPVWTCTALVRYLAQTHEMAVSRKSVCLALQRLRLRRAWMPFRPQQAVSP